MNRRAIPVGLLMVWAIAVSATPARADASPIGTRWQVMRHSRVACHPTS